MTLVVWVPRTIPQPEVVELPVAALLTRASGSTHRPCTVEFTISALATPTLRSLDQPGIAELPVAELLTRSPWSIHQPDTAEFTSLCCGIQDPRIAGQASALRKKNSRLHLSHQVEPAGPVSVGSHSLIISNIEYCPGISGGQKWADGCEQFV